MPVEITKVEKNGVVKEIRKTDLPDYVALGWKEVKDNSTSAQDVKYKYMT